MFGSPIYKKSSSLSDGRKRSNFDPNTAADLNKLQKQIGDNLSVQPSDLNTIETNFGDGTNKITSKQDITSYFEYLKSKIISKFTQPVITVYSDSVSNPGQLTDVTALNHGFSVGNNIEIKSSGNISGFYFIKKVINSDNFSIIYKFSNGTSVTGSSTAIMLKDKILQHDAELLPAGLIVIIAGDEGIGNTESSTPIAGLKDCPPGYIQCKNTTIDNINSIFNGKNVKYIPGHFIKIAPSTAVLGNVSSAGNNHDHGYDHIHSFLTNHDHLHNHEVDSHDHGQAHFHNDIDNHVHDFGWHQHTVSGETRPMGEDMGTDVGNLPGHNKFDTPVFSGDQHYHTYSINLDQLGPDPTMKTGTPYGIFTYSTIVPTGNNNRRLDGFEGETSNNTSALPVPAYTENQSTVKVQTSDHLPRQRTIIFCMKI